MAEEEKKKAEPQIPEERLTKVKKLAKIEKAAEQAEKEGRDPKSWMLDVTAETATREIGKKRKKKKKKQGGDDEDEEGDGWAAFDEGCQHKAYKKRVKRAIESRGSETIRQEAIKQKLETDDGRGEAELVHGMAPAVPAENVDRMVKELAGTVARRGQFSRRRPVLTDAGDVDFVSERNRRFNSKIARAYEPYTAEIKANLERGTAI